MKLKKKFFELRKIDFVFLENKNNYIIYKINKSEKRAPDLSDPDFKNEVLELITQKNKYDYNVKLFEKIKDNKFSEKDFKKMGDASIKNLVLNSIKDNKKFEINAVELLYSLPINSFTLINDEKNNIYLAKVKSFENEIVVKEKLEAYDNKHNSNIKNTMLKSYDLFLNDKYNVILNQKTIERVKNYFQ